MNHIRSGNLYGVYAHMHLLRNLDRLFDVRSSSLRNAMGLCVKVRFVIGSMT